MNQKQKSLNQVVAELLVPNNTVTTLEVKQELRRREPNVAWTQNEVSTMMDGLHQENKLSYVNTGIYRVYSSINVAANIRLRNPVVRLPKVDLDINTDDAITVIQGTNNRFFGVTYTRRNGGERKLICRFVPGMQVNQTNIELIDHNEGSNIFIDKASLTELRINNTIYHINA